MHELLQKIGRRLKQKKEEQKSHGKNPQVFTQNISNDILVIPILQPKARTALYNNTIHIHIHKQLLYAIDGRKSVSELAESFVSEGRNVEFIKYVLKSLEDQQYITIPLLSAGYATPDQQLLNDMVTHIHNYGELQFAHEFYTTLQKMYPEMAPFFRRVKDWNSLKTKLMSTITYVVREFAPDDVQFQTKLKIYAELHKGIGIRPFHYLLLGDALIATFKDVFPFDFTPRYEQAWIIAYMNISRIMILQAEY